jgi:hypothetical protein
MLTFAATPSVKVGNLEGACERAFSEGVLLRYPLKLASSSSNSLATATLYLIVCYLCRVFFFSKSLSASNDHPCLQHVSHDIAKFGS